MPGRRVRRHLSQLSEFERSFIIGMKTVGWSTRRVGHQVGHRSFGVCSQNMLGAVDTRLYPRAMYRVWSNQEDDETRGSKNRAGRARGSHSDSLHDTIRCRDASCSINHFQTPCGSESSIQRYVDDILRPMWDLS
ncbi:hypothetical protein AVEN_40385-1 [Araneus ventricosus]|uniref:Uncharacterized protein n=1 Tax=Araneus ventricosus TaxID=182803 RepID=A0A4Y2RAK4_ARAVE|nr:hypothetical protein AVEN_40385-1 [Araneus ventricosus]